MKSKLKACIASDTEEKTGKEFDFAWLTPRKTDIYIFMMTNAEYHKVIFLVYLFAVDRKGVANSRKSIINAL